MAGLQERSGAFRVILRHNGRQSFVALGKVSGREAQAKAAQVDDLLLRLEQRLIELPAGVDIVEFVRFDGRPPGRDGAATGPAPRTTLAALRERYLATHAGALEPNTLYTAGIHFQHLVATLGEKFSLDDLTQADLQRHIARRSDLGIAPVTIQKEVHGLILNPLDR